MSLWVWFVIGAVLALLLGLGNTSKPGKSKGRVRAKTAIDPDERKAKLIDESIQIAKTTKRRDTAESRLQVAETVLEELVSEGSSWVDEQTERTRIARVRDSFKARFPS